VSYTQDLCRYFFSSTTHPYVLYENLIQAELKPTDTLLDAGCGRTAPILRKFQTKCKKLIGVDLEKAESIEDVEYLQGDISAINLPDASVDIVISRAVLEHVKDPLAVFQEINRVLKPGGKFIFLLPNLYDYVSLLSLIIPNKYHKAIVSKMEGRHMDDVFPAYYKANTYSAIDKLCVQTNFKIQSFQYLGQYPSMFMFNAILFLIATAYEKLISHFEFLKFLRGWLLVSIVKV
jgi:ubiquinone/menaquinone biosynthesis C-methylase UbiE